MRNRAINLRRAVVGKDRAARWLPLLGIGIGQIVTNRLPSGALVARLEDHVTAVIESIFPKRGAHQRRIPGEAVFHLRDTRAVVIAHLGADGLLIARAKVGAQERAAWRLA